MSTVWKKFALVCTLAALVFTQPGSHAQTEPAASPAPAGDNPILLRQILIADSVEAAQALPPAPRAGFVALTPALGFLNVAELHRRLIDGQNRPINDQLLAALKLVLETALHEQNFPKATVVFPPQQIKDGSLRVALLLNQPPPQVQAVAPANPIHLRQILITESVEGADALKAVPNGGFVVLSPALSALLKRDAFLQRLAEGENKVLDDRLLVAISRVVESVAKSQDLPLATALIPPQNIADGTLRVALLLGKFREIKFQGNRWFSESLLREMLKVNQGEIVRFSEIDRSVAWANNNPFRRIRVHIDPIPNSTEANLIVGVQERIPLRLVASYDNGGSEVIGKSRYTAAISYANLWGRDHQASYQYITTNKPHYFQGHALDYRVPLPWRHHLQFSSSYFSSDPELYQGLFLNEGESLTADLRYTVPLRVGVNNADLVAGLSFKQSNNNLTWDPSGNSLQILGTKTDVFQMTVGASTVRRDKRGAWAFGANVTFSPGGINSRNSDSAFDAGRYGRGDSARIGAKARYAYASLSVQRLFTLAPGWDLMSRAVVQAAQSNLLASEQIAIGGASTVRGFNENTFAGDQGVVWSTELLAPPVSTPLPRLSKWGGPLDTRFLAFFDIGDTGLHQRFPIDTPRSTLRSTGVGLRMSFATNFSLTADYGWHLSKLPYAVDRHTRAHVKATLAY
ncbi:MAG: ShlB/FhaC/HecB family hemolysin secretion/activation protein [Opitutaceae bacterium]|nr:ShlB/FhaC/HecB family hemolysin secretion/activation protein [Opitutaceae bacterium]